jgi:hypothetical protein
VKIIIVVCLGVFTLSTTVSAQFIISSSGGALMGDQQFVAYSIGDVVAGTFESDSYALLTGFLGSSGLLITSSEEPELGVPNNFELSQNYPNPFNPSTNINYSLPKMAKVKLEIYNSIGVLVSVLVDEEQSAGRHAIAFNASQISSGMYFYRLIANGNIIQTKKMILIK